MFQLYVLFPRWQIILFLAKKQTLTKHSLETKQNKNQHFPPTTVVGNKHGKSRPSGSWMLPSSEVEFKSFVCETLNIYRKTTSWKYFISDFLQPSMYWQFSPKYFSLNSVQSRVQLTFNCKAKGKVFSAHTRKHFFIRFRCEDQIRTNAGRTVSSIDYLLLP